LFTTSVIVSTVLAMTAQGLPTVRVTSDNTRITESCVVVISPCTVIEDADGDGVIQIVASGITVQFADGSCLRGSASDLPPDEYKGYGIRVAGQSNVTIRGVRVSGFWCGLWATKADGLALDAVDASDNRRARLKSTPAAEDGGDWLFPHDNDQNEWLENYGSAVYVEDSNQITVHDCKVRHGQNALCIDRVNDSKIYDNDFSFNSGWGIAMWRSSRNTISRNACDFCVRGYSHRVYNRGQDSAGILMFEQNCENVLAENSATHGGDSFFGFAGKEALGESGDHPLDWYKRRGNSANLLIANDFSYAPAHGIEMTFSFGNVFWGNRLVENAICGVWGGYSQDTLIARNQIEGNGEMAYGLERGGINIEHGRGNRILANVFANNQCGVHLWGGPVGDFAQKPWAKANGTDSKDNIVAGNQFTGDKLAFHLRGPSELAIGKNSFERVGQEMSKEAEAVVREQAEKVRSSEGEKIGESVERDGSPGENQAIRPSDLLNFSPSSSDLPFSKLADTPREPQYTAYGKTRPVGARPHLRGRQSIVMTEWGPWDHESPLIRVVQDNGDSIHYDLHNMGKSVMVTVEGKGVTWERSASEKAGEGTTYAIRATAPGVHPYLLQVKSGDWKQEIHGTLISAIWDVTFFKWDKETDPRENLDAWRKLARDEKAVSGQIKQLTLKYGWSGPSEQNLSEAITAAKLGGDYFGMIARTRLPLSAGTWEFTTLSDDGVRVTVDILEKGRSDLDSSTKSLGSISLKNGIDGTLDARPGFEGEKPNQEVFPPQSRPDLPFSKPVIENWAWHGPTKDTGTLELREDKTVEIVVEHFEIDGYAVLELGVAPRSGPKP
jgi:parallel beta-helix repeat protein